MKVSRMTQAEAIRYTNQKEIFGLNINSDGNVFFEDTWVQLDENSWIVKDDELGIQIYSDKVFKRIYQ